VELYLHLHNTPSLHDAQFEAQGQLYLIFTAKKCYDISPVVH